MSNLTFYVTAVILGFMVADLWLMDTKPEWMVVSNWLRQHPIGRSPWMMLMASFPIGGTLGYMEPKLMRATFLDLSSETAMFCKLWFTAFLLWDVGAVHFGGVESSISRWMQNTAYKSPVISGGLGFLGGHFWGY